MFNVSLFKLPLPIWYWLLNLNAQDIYQQSDHSFIYQVALKLNQNYLACA